MGSVKPRTPLTRARVLHAALELADAHGVEALTMRRLGAALGVEAMSLYNHVANKDDVLEGILELVAEEITTEAEAAGWRAVLRSRAISAHVALLRHPWAGELWVRATIGPARMRHMEAVLRTLREAEFPPVLLDRAFHILESHVIGHAIQRVRLPASHEEMVEGGRRFLAEMDTDTYPELAEHIRWHLDHPLGQDGFTFGLDLILDGLGRLLDQQA